MYIPHTPRSFLLYSIVVWCSKGGGVSTRRCRGRGKGLEWVCGLQRRGQWLSSSWLMWHLQGQQSKVHRRVPCRGFCTALSASTHHVRGRRAAGQLAGADASPLPALYGLYQSEWGQRDSSNTNTGSGMGISRPHPRRAAAAQLACPRLDECYLCGNTNWSVLLLLLLLLLSLSRVDVGERRLPRAGVGLPLQRSILLDQHSKPHILLSFPEIGRQRSAIWDRTLKPFDLARSDVLDVESEIGQRFRQIGCLQYPILKRMRCPIWRNRTSQKSDFEKSEKNISHTLSLALVHTHTYKNARIHAWIFIDPKR